MRKLLIDTNILVLWVVGTFDQEVIARNKRTAVFTKRDFRTLVRFRRKHGSTLTTASILAEASNLFGNDFHVSVASALIEVCRHSIEIVTPKADIFADASFDRLGYADVSALLAMDEETTLLTDDLSLYAQALDVGHDAINFNHLRRRP